MAMQTNLEALIEAAKHLTKEEREKLVAALHPRREIAATPHHITEMRGLGKDLWDGIDPQDYLNRERDSWDS
jgi:hypothetical protein